MAQPQPKKDWRHLAEQASKETDPGKMIALVKELIRAFDEKQKPKLVARDDASKSVSGIVSGQSREG